MRDLTDGRGVALVLECVGGPVLEKSVRCVASYGRLVSYGNASGQPANLAAGDITTLNRTVIGFSMGRSPIGSLDHQGAMDDLFPMIMDGRLKLIVDRVMPMSEAGNAHLHLASRGTRGKVILDAVTSAAERYAAVYDAALAANRFRDHRMPGDHWADLAPEFRLDPKRPWNSEMAAVAGYLRPTDTFLDVGGGAGRVSLALASQVAEVVLVEPSDGMRSEFIAARRDAGIDNARVTSDWWLDSPETGDVVHVCDVTYFVRDIAPFVIKLHDAASRRVVISIWRPTPGDMDNEMRRLLFDERAPRWPGLPELASVLWELGLLPDIRPIRERPWWIPEVDGGLSTDQAIEFAMQRLERDDDAARRDVADNLGSLFESGDRGLSPRWLGEASAVLLTWETRGRKLAQSGV